MGRTPPQTEKEEEAVTVLSVECPVCGADRGQDCAKVTWAVNRAVPRLCAVRPHAARIRAMQVEKGRLAHESQLPKR